MKNKFSIDRWYVVPFEGTSIAHDVGGKHGIICRLEPTIKEMDNARMITATPALIEIARYIRGSLTETGECTIKLGDVLDRFVSQTLDQVDGLNDLALFKKNGGAK